jgi:hypothetical protein
VSLTKAGVGILNDSARCRLVAQPAHFLSLSTMVPPFCLWVPDAGIIGRQEVIQDTGATQNEEQTWSAYLGAASFGPDGEGVFGQAAGMNAGEDIATMMAALFAAIDGKQVYAAGGILGRAFAKSWTLWSVPDAGEPGGVPNSVL